MNKEVWKNFWKKFWFVVWKDDSFKGWIISLVFIFIVIKFVFFPLLSLATGTSLPLAIVESCSMYHDGNMLGSFDSWWNKHEEKYTSLDIEKTTFEDYIFNKGFNKGDILFIHGTKPEDIKIGDVIIFQSVTKNPIIHRVIDIKQENEKYYFSTIGDNNNGQLSIEKEISQDQIIGKASFKLVPYVGWVKLVFFEFSRAPQERGFCEEN